MGGVERLRVAVVGLGPMGRGIARVFAGAGARVTVVDAGEDATRANLATLHEEAARDGAPVEVGATADLAAAAADADLVVEAVVENMEVKRELLAALARAGSPELVVASNTSSLSVAEMGRAFGDPSRVVGMHFFNPPTKMRLVEVVRGPRTADAVVERALGWCADLDKTAVVCTDSPNFVVNRVCRPLYYEAQLLVSQGVEPAVVDAVARRALGHRMGPLELLDFTGLHTHLASSETALREFGDPRYRPIPLARSLVRAGLTGRAAGRGFYDYGAGKPSAAQARVVRPAPPSGGSGGSVRPAGPDAAPPPGDGPVLYAGAPRAAADDVRRLLADGERVVVDSSHGGWLDALPPGAGWLRLHDGAAFAEVVVDDVAGVAATPAVEEVLAAFGAASVRVPALPGLVADRLMYCLVNEASAVVEEGTAGRDAVDTALRLGMNHPVGPWEYLDRVGPDRVVEGLLALQDGLGDPRYRPSALLRRCAAGARRRG